MTSYKEAFEILVNVSDSYLGEDLFLITPFNENVNNAVSNLLNFGTLGGLVDYSDVIQIALQGMQVMTH